MRCSACEHENREGRKFCASCGARLAVTCPACSTLNEPSENFCGECGAALTAVPRTPSLPKHLADKILQASRMLKKAEQMVNVICQALCKPLIYIIREITGNPISAAC
jgi:hypothetical protein